MAFADNNNALYEAKMKVDDVNEVTFSVLENKRSGIMRASIREFKHKLNTVEDVEKYQKEFNDFFENAKKLF